SDPSLPALSALRALALLLPHLLAAVADPFALVRLRLLDGADLRRLLADGFLIDAVDADVELARVGFLPDLTADALARLDLHRVTGPDRDTDVLSHQFGAVADADDVQRLGVAVRHALDHVGNQRARKAVQRAVRLLIRRPLDAYLAILDHHLHPLRQLPLQ